ncbi:haloacid dehalogenase [Mycoplasmoides gallisepticum]|uniref:Haloacid dehalogenase n=2 Tax=Mycoplasmoides gallisepticum TaxID=2096 RepID=A0AB36DT76_MYCGL|nr:Cof-type HAD-IIB family hydrolase [Mycoplasmoides gallisepticum]OBU78947.1 haloacid dehalogenase [Mycoplasmoides gallisepticum]OBU79294.1 haloacid dehalogenase [Mycoplasmoides gallisepticum]OBU79758.1 haloacid dehalogenase [Mycoplasmoides gallisepticum]OBU80872.1 haloacid dehalogenase [Mycoplasmoides gallisepticum]OBU81325.1 haloacid dehalogenase [Mycoplasmoides gallisepticum]
MKNKKLLIISDLDGTLLNNESKLSYQTIKVIKLLNKLGHHFCIATGRPSRASIDIYNELGLNTVMANLNGSYIWHPKDRFFKAINLSFSKDIVKNLLHKTSIIKLVDNFIVENNEVTYIMNKPVGSREHDELLKCFHIDGKDNCIFGQDKILNLRQDPNTILLQVKNPHNIDEVVFQLKECFSTFVVRKWSLPVSGNIIEVNTVYANKGNALDYLSSYYGIPKEFVVTFGDGENDIEMLQKSRFGYAMKNAISSAKLLARYITKYNNNDHGVAFELYHKIIKRSLKNS